MEKDLSNLHLGTDGLYYEDYVAPEEPGTFTGKLVSRQWWYHGSRFALICNFLTGNGQRIALFAFQKDTGFYGPRYGEVNFKTAEIDTWWECEVRMTRTGRCTWICAQRIDGQEAPEREKGKEETNE